MVLAHGVLALFNVSFDSVVEVLKGTSIASNVFLEVLNCKPRVAFAVGEKYFFRAKNYLSATTVVFEVDEGVLVKVIASGGREGLLDFFDMGSSKDYAHLILGALSAGLKSDYKIISEVDYLDQSSSEALKFSVS